MLTFARCFAARSSRSLFRIIALLALMLVAPAHATTATDPPAFFPLSSGSFVQDWTDTSLISTADNWRAIPSIRGYIGDIGSPPTGTNPQTITASVDGELDVQANQTNPSAVGAAGGVAEFEIADPTIAINGSGAADFPHIVLFLDSTGRENLRIEYDLRDLDASTDNSIQQVALQYRINGTDPYFDVPAGYVADATTGPSVATLVTHVDVVLPAPVNNVSQLQIRIMTSNAAGTDEWVGIDNIEVTSDPTPIPTTVELEMLGLGGGGGSEPAGAPVSVQRCISITAYDCDGIERDMTLDLIVEFTDGLATVELDDVNPDAYDCVTAVDPLHSLSSSADIDEGGMADLTGSNGLRQGDLDASGFVDILDFGLYVGAFGDTAPVDADCDDLPTHADFTGDGVVNVLEFGFISLHFLQSDDDDCCKAEAAMFDPGRRRAFAPAWTWKQAPFQAALLHAGPITSISTQQLRAMSLPQAVAGDLNHDGWLNIQDMEQFAGGLFD